jgi:hypothetical protein
LRPPLTSNVRLHERATVPILSRTHVAGRSRHGRRLELHLLRRCMAAFVRVEQGRSPAISRCTSSCTGWSHRSTPWGSYSAMSRVRRFVLHELWDCRPPTPLMRKLSIRLLAKGVSSGAGRVDRWPRVGSSPGYWRIAWGAASCQSRCRCHRCRGNLPPAIVRVPPNPSVKGTSTSGLRPLASAPYLER